MDGNNENENIEQSRSYAISHESSRYGPSVQDVMAVRDVLFVRLGLPIELIDTIIDMAEYWPCTSTITRRSVFIRAQIDRENQFLLRSYPLGFLPTEEEDQEFQMLPEYKHAYQSMEPQPWPESREPPIDATEEVFKKWETASLPRGDHPCRKIVFTIKSRDQGWGGGLGRGTYKNSFTWFDAGLERVTAFRETHLLEARELAPFPQFRLNSTKIGTQEATTSGNSSTPVPPIVCSLRSILPHTVENNDETQHDHTSRHPLPDIEEKPKYTFKHDLNPSSMVLQKNVTGSREIREHTVTWSYKDDINPDSVEAQELEKAGRGYETGTGDAVRSMKTGDVVTVWAKARYAGWLNQVEEVKIDVYWAV